MESFQNFSNLASTNWTADGHPRNMSDADAAAAPLPPCLQLETIAHAINAVAQHNRDFRDTKPTIFDAVQPANISTLDYLVRIRKYTKFNQLCFLVAFAYLGKLAYFAGEQYCITVNNLHRMLITAIAIAAKAYDDTYHANGHMALCGGICAAELNLLELEMCKQMRWAFTVEMEDLERLATSMQMPDSPYWQVWLNVPWRGKLPHTVQDISNLNVVCASNQVMSTTAHSNPGKQQFDVLAYDAKTVGKEEVERMSPSSVMSRAFAEAQRGRSH